MAKAWLKEKINSIKKKTSIGNSRLSQGAGIINARRVKNIEVKASHEL
jgi:hypothetical protein